MADEYNNQFTHLRLQRGVGTRAPSFGGTLRARKPVLREFASSWRAVLGDEPTRRRLAAFERWSPSEEHKGSTPYEAAALDADTAHAWAIYDWVLRVAIPAVLEDAGLVESAEMLRSAPVGNQAALEDAFVRVAATTARAYRASWVAGLSPRTSLLALKECGITAATDAIEGAPGEGRFGRAWQSSGIATLAYNAEHIVRADGRCGMSAATARRIRESGVALAERLARGETLAKTEPEEQDEEGRESA